MEPRRTLAQRPGFWLLLIAFWGVLIWLLALQSCDDEITVPTRPQGSSPASTSPGSVPSTDVCGDQYENAGDSFTYSREDLNAFERFGLNSAEEEVEARIKAVERHCGKIVERTVCPDDRPQAGREFTHRPGEFIDDYRLAEECGRTEAEREAFVAEQQAQRDSGLHCLSKWDGNYDELEDLVRPLLMDPSSMETTETLIYPVDEAGKHNVVMVFTAADASGTTVTLTAFGLANTVTCRAELLGIE